MNEFTAVEIHAIDPTTRVTVFNDSDSESPLSWGDHVTIDSPEYLAWADGNVYCVEIEKLVTYLLESDHSKKFQRWESVDALSGCYLTDTYTALDVAAEYYSITPVAA
jgi:hypothetical protein